MITQAQLLAKNNPTTPKQFIFKLGDVALPCVILDLIAWGSFSGDISGFAITTQEGSYNFSFPVNELMTNESTFNDLEMYLPGSETPVYNFETVYFKVVFFAYKIYIILFDNTCVIDTVSFFDETAMTATDGTFDDSYTLQFAPDGWEDDEYKLQRDMKLFGVFRKFTVAEMKFVKDGRDYLLQRYEATGVNTDTTFTVTENTPSGNTRVRFIGKIDYSTLKRTELSVDVQVIDGAFTDLVLRRSKETVNLLGRKSIDGATLAALTPTQITIPEINIVEVAAWEEHDTTAILDEDHSLQMDVVNSEYSEGQSTSGLIGGKFFVDATEDYLATTILIKILAAANGNTGAAHFTWVFHLDRWSGGVLSESDIWSLSFESTGTFPMSIEMDEQQTFDIYTGDSLVLRAEIINDIGTGDIQYSNIDIKLNTQIESIPWRGVNGVLYHEAFSRIIEHLTGLTGRFKSDFFGRTDIGYTSDGIRLGAITTGRYIRQRYGMNNTIPVSLDGLFTSQQAIECLGMGIETVSGVEKVVVEPMEHFFNNQVILNISNRIHEETIEKQYYPELAFNRISVGFNSFDYRSIGGIYEFNTTSKFSTCIKPVDKELNIVAPYRGDMSGVIALITEPAENKDVSGEEDIFILDTIRDGWNFIVRTSEGFVQADDLGNRDTLFNLIISPARSLIRWGSYLRGFLNHYLSSFLVWQTSDKNTKLTSTETGLDPVVENADIQVSDLAEPLWHPEIFTLEVPALENDIDLIKANPYGLIRITDTEYGWIISYRSKNENKKSEFTLLRCNTDYVTPNWNPVLPASITIKKVITDLPEDYKEFGITILCSGGSSYYNIPIKQQSPILLTNVPYGDYIVTETLITDGYSLVSITPNTFTIDEDNLHFDVEIVNSKDPIIETIKYGALYNWYAAKDIRGLAASGWEVPYDELWIELINYCGSDVLAYNYLSEAGTLYWNVGSGSNLYNFNARGGGARAYDNGAFTGLKSNGVFVTVTAYGGTNYVVALAVDSSALIGTDGYGKSHGASCRLVKLTTSLAHGETGTYTGNDGKVYRTICIGTQEWLADNLNETKYRNGDIIPVVTDNATWAALTTGARCSYNNDDSNL